MSESNWPETRDVVVRLLKSRGLSVRQGAEEMGVSHTTLKRLLDGQSGEPYSRTRDAIARWIEAADSQAGALHDRIAPHENDGGGGAAAIIGGPEALRGTFAELPSDNYELRLAIMRRYEDVLLKHGFPPPKWPVWFRELRKEFLDRKE